MSAVNGTGAPPDTGPRGATVRVRRGSGGFRIGLWFLMLTQLGVGGMQLLAPQVFYDEFPAPGHYWVAWVPPYSEHLMRDVGALNLGVGAVAVVAAVTLDRLMVRTFLVAYLVFSVPHLVFHATHLERFPFGDAVVQTAVLVAAVVLPAILLLFSGRLDQAGLPG